MESLSESLSKSFLELSVSKSTFHKFLKDECVDSFYSAIREAVERNSVEKIQQWFEFVSAILKSDVEYSANCIFFF